MRRGRSRRWARAPRRRSDSVRSTTISRPSDRTGEALDALRQAVRLNPQDREGRTILARATVASGDVLRRGIPRSARRPATIPCCSPRSSSSISAPGGSRRARELMTRAARSAIASCGTGCWRPAGRSARAIRTRHTRASTPSRTRRSPRRISPRRPAHLAGVRLASSGPRPGAAEARRGLRRRRARERRCIRRRFSYRRLPRNGQAVEARVIAEDLVAREP